MRNFYAISSFIHIVSLCLYSFSWKITPKKIVLVSLFNYNQACFKCYFRCESIFLNLVPPISKYYGYQIDIFIEIFPLFEISPSKTHQKGYQTAKSPPIFPFAQKSTQKLLFLKNETKALKSPLNISCKKTPQPQIYKSAAASHIGKPQRLIILL